MIFPDDNELAPMNPQVAHHGSMRKVDGWQTLATKIVKQTFD
jgi:hypothetical protein